MRVPFPAPDGPVTTKTSLGAIPSYTRGREAAAFRDLGAIRIRASGF
jgi:hypothetical protein